MARLIDADKFEVYTCVNKSSDDDFKKAIKNMPQSIIVDAVPVSELEKLRDYLYAEDLIFMRGLAKLNKLIAKYGGTEAGKTPDKNTKP